jgi:hypothetical protein
MKAQRRYVKYMTSRPTYNSPDHVALLDPLKGPPLVVDTHPSKVFIYIPPFIALTWFIFLGPTTPWSVVLVDLVYAIHYA